MAEATGEAEPEFPAEKNPIAVERGRMGGLIGGRARAQELTKEKRESVAKSGAKVRWAGE